MTTAKTFIARIMERGPGYAIVRILLDDQMLVELEQDGPNDFITLGLPDDAVRALEK